VVSKSADHNVSAEMRALARRIFTQALAQCSVGKAFKQNVECSRSLLRVAEDLYDLNAFSRVLVIAMGKAARPMAEALAEQVGEAAKGILVELESGIGKPMLPGFRHYFGGHPLPTKGSVDAAKAILKTLSAQSQMENALVIYLLSGGASAMVETPIDKEITLDDLLMTYRGLVHSGAPIAKVNAIRKHLSAIKGGRLALMANNAGAAQQVSIMVSDVPEAMPDALGSGPTMPDSATVEDCYAIASEYKLTQQFPQSVSELFEKKLLEETPKQEDGVFHHSRWWTVLSNESLQRAAASIAAEEGFAVEVDNSCDDWDYARSADYLLEKVRKLRQGVSRVCLISGGEVTVRVPAKSRPGRGGRNQQFALYCATKIAGEKICVLSAGSDGIDGDSPAAGGVVDGTTASRAPDIAEALGRFDAFPLLERLGDAVMTGATGNNIRDLRVLLAW
jgi:hydroxypyruvate reductase